MFEINEYVVHNLYGVLQINDIEEMEFDGVKNKYYVCHALFGSNQGTTIKIPIKKSDSLHKLLTKKEANDLIQTLPTLKIEWIPESKHRIQKYEEILMNSDINDLFASLRVCHQHRDTAKLTTKDKEFIEQAERIVYGVLAVSLGIDYDSVEEYIDKSLA